VKYSKFRRFFVQGVEIIIVLEISALTGKSGWGFEKPCHGAS